MSKFMSAILKFIAEELLTALESGFISTALAIILFDVSDQTFGKRPGKTPLHFCLRARQRLTSRTKLVKTIASGIERKIELELVRSEVLPNF